MVEEDSCQAFKAISPSFPPPLPSPSPVLRDKKNLGKTRSTLLESNKPFFHLSGRRCVTGEDLLTTVTEDRRRKKATTVSPMGYGKGRGESGTAQSTHLVRFLFSDFGDLVYSLEMLTSDETAAAGRRRSSERKEEGGGISG